MIPVICAWKGCRKNIMLGPPLPEEWRHLATFATPATPGFLDFRTDPVIRDGVLCPEHAEELESLLKPLA